MTNKTGRYSQVSKPMPITKTKERKTPLSQPGKFNREIMDKAKPILTPNGGRR